jgi:photosystem II stability/assembly factor-like uncharacterized protein
MVRRFTTFQAMGVAYAALYLLSAAPLSAASQPRWISAGPFGGNAEVITASATDPDLLLAGTKNANLFISRNAGENWTALDFPRQYSSMLHTLVIHPTKPGVFYAAIAEDRLPGLYRSVDAGKTWQPVKGLAADNVYSLTIWNEDPMVMAAGTQKTVQLSRDGGVTWKAISPAGNVELQPVVSVAFDPHSDSIIYAGTPRLPWKTVDGGQNWDLIADGMSTDSDIISLRVDPARPSHVLIGACSGFWHSSNAGKLWSKFGAIPFTSRRTYAFVQDPGKPELIFAGTSRGLYRTSDGGDDWKEIAPHEIKSLAIAGGVLYVATADAGLFKSTDAGVTLQPIDQGFTSRNFARISEAGEHLYTGTGMEEDAGAVFSSSDGGLHWERVNEPSRLDNASVIAVVRGAGQTLLASTGAALFRSTDAGQTWTRLKNPIAASKITALTVAGSVILAGTSSGVFRSENDGLIWHSTVSTREPVRFLIQTSTSTYAVLKQDLLASEDSGATWTSRRLPFFADTYDVAASAGTILAGTSRGLFHSEDGGQTWHTPHSGLPLASITSVAIDPAASGPAFAFEYGNLYESRDGGNNWHRCDQEGLGGAFVRNFAIATQGPHHLLAVTATRGIYVREIIEGIAAQSGFSAVDSRKENYVPNQQNDKAPAL